MKKLSDIAGRYKELALNYMTSGPWNPIYDTGNLYQKFSSFNNIQRIIKSSKEDHIVLSLNYSPTGAEYGKYVEEGTRYMKKRPFVEYAANDDQLTLMINNYTKERTSAEFELIMNDLDGKFQSLSDTSKG